MPPAPCMHVADRHAAGVLAGSVRLPGDAVGLLGHGWCSAGQHGLAHLPDNVIRAVHSLSRLPLWS